MAKIYISSTFSDLVEYRKAAYDILCSMDHSVKAMEHYVAADQRPLDKCLADVEACEIYVGIFAWRYGFIPDAAQGNPARRSITELEYRRARETGKPCLIYLLDETHPWPPPKIEKDEGEKHLARFRKELGDAYNVSFFKTPDELAKLVSASVANLRMNAPPPSPSSSSLDTARISIARLPVTGPDLFGREAELQLLDDAWADPSTNVIAFVAWGGVGKSALVNTWLARMATERYRGAERVFAWSFYSQGTSEDRAASADLFIDAALRWFGDEDPTAGSPWDKGERLANHIRRTRTLLALDGLEPLQQPPGPEEGKLKDQALQALLRELAAQQRGLCVVSTRLKIRDLEGFAHSAVRQEDLDHLTPQAGAQLLRAQGAKGDDAELEAASVEFGGHSLALTLLGSYLADVCGGDIRRRREIGNLEADERHGGHARRVMAAYETWLGEGPELAVLRLLGLFDRPAPADAIAVLRAAPLIPGLTDALQNLSETKWRQTLSKLRRIKLLSEQVATDFSLSPVMGQTKVRPTDELDAHPLVREHFGQQLRERLPDAWREANNRLYEHLTRTAKELPETLEEMAPLFAAVAHGCAAGRYQESIEMLDRRIRRGEEAFSLKKLGAIGADLAALTNFFDTPWQQPVPVLTDWFKASILSDVGFCLKALGRLKEAAQPIQAALEARISEENWKYAALNAGNLSELYLHIGDLPKAITFARQSVELADRSGDSRQKTTKRTTLADALHQAGYLTEAERAFREAEEMQIEWEPQEEFLYSLQGYQFCDLLLGQGRYQEVETRAVHTLEWARQFRVFLAIALDNLSLGRTYLLYARQEEPRNYARSADFLNRAVDDLRRGGRLDFLPLGLLARAELHRLAGDSPRAQTDLAEARRIAERGEMGLHLADCHLEWARLWLAQGERDPARAHWATAQAMIARMGYHRRDRDVAEIARELG